jgi:site-specific recombinase XerD
VNKKALKKIALAIRLAPDLDTELRRRSELTGISKIRIRHTFASYAIAHHKDLARVAAMLGNSPGVIKRHYDGLATPSDAARFFR